jgi:excisionase family DNA binding protein
MDDVSAHSRLLLRVDEVAEVLNVGRNRVFDLIRSGELRSIKLGGLRRVPVSAVHEMVNRLVTESVP